MSEQELATILATVKKEVEANNIDKELGALLLNRAYTETKQGSQKVSALKDSKILIAYDPAADKIFLIEENEYTQIYSYDGVAWHFGGLPVNWVLLASELNAGPQPTTETSSVEKSEADYCGAV